MMKPSQHRRAERFTQGPLLTAAGSLRRRWLGAAMTAVALIASGCAIKVPSTVQPVTSFQIEKYAGTWYEVARIDHFFERGLVNVSAQYVLNPDGTVKVVNRGFDPETGKWKESQGKARFTGASDVAALKVSFFGPFYGGYNVVHLDEGYQTALVIGSSLDYMWILSRDKTMSPQTRSELMRKAQQVGVDLRKVIEVRQD
jgi:apolipoprotein D and lipocalin family protein